jgi:Ca-activated chloride channel family protein
MKLSPDDPKLTAYALGELPEVEAKEIARAMANSPELRKAVEEIRETASLLKTGFAAEPVAKLSEAQKEAVMAKTEPINVVDLRKRSFWKTAGISAVAASIAMVIAWQAWERAPQSTDLARVKDAEITDNGPEDLGVEKSMPSESIPAYPPPSPAPQEAPEAEPPAPVKITERPTAVASTPATAAKNLPALAKREAETQAFKADGTVLFANKPQNNSTAYGIVTTSRSGSKSSPIDNFAFNAPGQARANGGASINGHVGDGDVFYSSAPVVAYNWDERFAVTSEQLKDAQKQLAELQNNYTEQHPKVILQREEIEKMFRKHPTRNRDSARYPKYVENGFQRVLDEPLSTFSIDVDTASYANVRRFLNDGQLPPADAVRIEEMINYFSYDYPQPKGDEPFSVNMEVAGCPWEPEHRLLRVGLKGKEIAENKRPPSNFVFLIDVSGSMSPQERLPLIKQSLRMLVKRMTENDRIAIVVYASSSGVVLESTSCDNKEKILAALDRLEAGGSTNGGDGIKRAYGLAEENFIKNGVNRVILCTDGDFNVGITDQGELIELIQRKAKTGVFLSALGVGDNNYKDALLQKLADKGNGNYYYIDTLEEGHKVLVQQMNGTLVTIAKDVKIQIEFNPAQVTSYRLIGYEKRILATEDFNNDKKDAGEIGAGHTVTALYELVPAGISTASQTAVDDLKYQRKTPAQPAKEGKAINDSRELLTLKLRYKKPDGDKSVLREHTLVESERKFTQTSTDFRFAAAVASFGMILKDSEHAGNANFGSILELAREAKGDDKEGYRAEFINLVKKAKSLKRGDE